jgi:hypothetical protein
VRATRRQGFQASTIAVEHFLNAVLNFPPHSVESSQARVAHKREEREEGKIKQPLKASGETPDTVIEVERVGDFEAAQDNVDITRRSMDLRSFLGSRWKPI